jgi:hypothetical protein
MARQLPPRDARGRFVKRQRVPADLLQEIGRLHVPLVTPEHNCLEVVPPPVIIDVGYLIPRPPTRAGQA